MFFVSLAAGNFLSSLNRNHVVALEVWWDFWMHCCCSNCCILVSEYEFVSPMYDNDNIKCVKVIIFVTQFIKIMMATNKKVLLTSVSQASILCDLCFFKFLYKNCSTCNDKNDLIKESVNARNNLIFFLIYSKGN